MPMYPELQDKVCHSAVLHDVPKTEGSAIGPLKKALYMAARAGPGARTKLRDSFGYRPYRQRGPTLIGSTDRQRLLLLVPQRSIR
jgi:hypothetical protein